MKRSRSIAVAQTCPVKGDVQANVDEHVRAVCADIGRPAHPQQAAARGANTYLASMFVIPSDLEGELSKLRRYAVQHRMMTALANFGSGPQCDLVRDRRIAGSTGQSVPALGL
jgi:hypothetical protein